MGSRRGTLIGAVSAIVGGMTLAYAGIKRLSTSGGELKPVLPGEDLFYNWRGWKISYSKMGSGPPLIALHGIYAGASNYEMRRVFELFARDYTVYALDLLGFGRSDRPAIEYSDKLYINLIRDFIRDVVGPGSFALANSLAAAYAIEVAAREPNLLSGIILVSPTGLTSLAGMPAPAQEIWRRVLRAPLIGDVYFLTLTSKIGIRNFLETRVYFDAGLVTDSMVDQLFASSRQPGAKWPLIAFICGRLNHGVRFSFPLLRIPVLIIRGAQSTFTPLSEMEEFLSLNPRAELRQIENCGALPHDEKAAVFHRYARDWLTREILYRRLA